MRLNERQIKAVMDVKERGKITNKEYQKINKVSNKTAYLELNALVELQIMKKEGTSRNLVYKVMKK